VKVVTDDRFVWDFEDLDAGDADRFGGKGAGLARMVAAGIPVPAGFVIGTDAFRAYHEQGATLPARLEDKLDDAMARLERRTGRRFDAGGRAEPLLVSIRSGAPVSMPGMMDTVLNLGLDASAALAFGRTMQNPAFALDTWLRFWRMYAEIVLGLAPDDIEREAASAAAEALAVPSLETFEAVERRVVATIASAGAAVETSPRAQIRFAIAAVFGSWNSRRAKAYRENLGISDSLGTAVTIQAMVFGNRDARSGSGVAFSRNPNTGERGLFGEYMAGRQGEDIVSGTATPVDLSRPDALDAALLCALEAHGHALEALYRDAVDIEFTVESERLFLLQVRAAKRTAEAAVRIAVDLLANGTISREEAVRRVTPAQLGKLLRPTFDAAALQSARVLTAGIGSSPGHAAGAVSVDADDAAMRAAAGERIILLRPTTSPQDIRGMLVAEGIVTARGGALSHAAVVSRALDKPCIVGCEAIDVDVAHGTFTIGDETFDTRTMLSIDGETGRVYLGELPLRTGAGGRNRLGELVAAASEISSARVGVSAIDVADLRRVANTSADCAIVGLTDLLISAGNIERLTQAIGDITIDGRRADAEREIAFLIEETARLALEASASLSVAFRVPSFLSERARQIVASWAALPAKSLLPLGEKSFYVPIARGIAAAAGGDARASLLLSGLTDRGELAAFRRDIEHVGLPGVGAFVRSYAGLHNFARATGDGDDADVWVDVDAVVRSVYGFPSELMAAHGVFADYRERGLVAEDPQSELAPFLIDAFATLLHRVGAASAGAVCASGAEGTIVTSLYALGYRRFAVPASEREPVSLRLARHALGVDR
jgi:pyruvate,orthophosphate dikinase